MPTSFRFSALYITDSTRTRHVLFYPSGTILLSDLVIEPTRFSRLHLPGLLPELHRLAPGAFWRLESERVRDSRLVALIGPQLNVLRAEPADVTVAISPLPWCDEAEQAIFKAWPRIAVVVSARRWREANSPPPLTAADVGEVRP